MDKDQKKLMRKFTLLWFVSLAMILVILFLSVRDGHNDTRRYVDQQIKETLLANPISEPPEQPIPGKDGKDGRDGTDGKDSMSTTTVVQQPITTILQQNVPIPGEKGEKGDRGLPGQPGREIELGIKDGQVVWRYVGDEEWQTLVEVGL
jgi:hypothetical protein